nr:hypothetical protein [Tanacetum cinerariifolium]
MMRCKLKEAGIAKRRLGDVDLGCSNKAGAALCDPRKAEHIAKEADSHREGLDKIATAAEKVARSLIES